MFNANEPALEAQQVKLRLIAQRSLAELEIGTHFGKIDVRM
jgi:hypothetical protein